MTAYEDPIRIQILEDDWEHVKIASATSRGTSAQKLGGNMIAALVAEPLTQPLTNPSGPVKRRAVWIRLPVSSREAVDKIRKQDANATWSRLLHAAVLKDKQRG